MDPIKDILPNRAILTTISMRFDSRSQSVKRYALEQMIEQTLFVAKEDLTWDEIQDNFSKITGYLMIPSDGKACLKRLVKRARVIQKREGRFRLYTLPEGAKRDCGDSRQQAESLIECVIEKLFRNAPGGVSAYRIPFLEFLCAVFSQLGYEYVQVLDGHMQGREFLHYPSISSALDQIEEEFPSIDHRLFENTVKDFLKARTPEFNRIKWNMVQNYFILKICGLDRGGFLLSKALFENAVFYLDTNIIIAALEPLGEHHATFVALNKAWRQLGVECRVCQISLDELRKLVSHERRLVEEVAGQIPDETAPKVDSVIYRIYWQKKRAGEPVDVDDIFRYFDSPEKDLRRRYKVGLEDDAWFDRARSDAKIIAFARTLISRYWEVCKRRKEKAAALHDSMLLIRLQELAEKEGNDRIYLLTADRSLPGAGPPSRNRGRRSLAITEDVLLQWISPLAVGDHEQDNFAALFAKIARNQLLPDRKFYLPDFRIFARMEMSCRELPSKDVEGCIRYLGKNASTLDPSDPDDYFELAREVGRFFASPEREYKRELRKKEEALVELKDKALLDSARLRMLLVALAFLVWEAATICLAELFGQGPNLFRKVLNSWMYLSVGPAIATLLVWYFVGKKRLEALGLPLTKILGLVSDRLGFS